MSQRWTFPAYFKVFCKYSDMVSARKQTPVIRLNERVKNQKWNNLWNWRTRSNMESKVKRNEERGADPGMIAAGLKKWDATMRLFGDKQSLNKESKPERKEGRGADWTDFGLEGEKLGGIHKIPECVGIKGRKYKWMRDAKGQAMRLLISSCKFEI